MRSAEDEDLITGAVPAELAGSNFRGVTEWWVDAQSSAKSFDRAGGEVSQPVHQLLKQGNELKRCSGLRLTFFYTAMLPVPMLRRQQRPEISEPKEFSPRSRTRMPLASSPTSRSVPPNRLGRGGGGPAKKVKDENQLLTNNRRALSGEPTKTTERSSHSTTGTVKRAGNLEHRILGTRDREVVGHSTRISTSKRRHGVRPDETGNLIGGNKEQHM